MAYNLTTSDDHHGPGVLILQHHRHKEDGWALHTRGAVLVARVIGRGKVGGWELERDQLGGANAGDLIGALIWPRTKERPIPAATFGLPVATTTDKPVHNRRGKGSPAITPHSGGGKSDGEITMAPLLDRSRQRDTKLDAVNSGYPTRGGKACWPRIPKRDWFGLGISATNEDEQIEHYLPTDPRMPAPNVSGDAEVGAWVIDMDGDGPDLEREGRLQTAFRVVKEPTSPWVDYHGENLIAFQIGETGLGDARGGCTFDADTSDGVGHLSQRQSGPLETCDGCTKHVLGTDADGNTIRSQHIALNAYYTDRDGAMDGPKEHRGELPFLPPRAPFKVDVWHYYHPTLPHEFIGGVRRGRHRWLSFSYKYEPPPPPIEEGPPYRPYEPVIHPDPIPRPIDSAGGGSRPDGAIGPRGSDKPAEPVQPIPKLEPVERLSFPKGIPPEYFRPPDTTGAQASEPYDIDSFFEDFLGIGSDAETFDRASDSEGLSRRREGARKRGIVAQYVAGDPMPPRSAELWPSTVGAVLWRAQHYSATSLDYRKARDLTQDDLDRYDRVAPVVIREEVVAAQSSTEDAFTYTTKPRHIDAASQHPGGTANGSMLFMPPERDAADYMIDSIPTRTTSTSYLALMDGVSLSLSAKISSGLPIDGLRVALTGSSGSKNASWTYLDASGSTRVGTLTHGGTIKPGGAAADLGALSDPWANIYGTDGDFAGDVNITGKLTVGGLIDPTGLVLTEQASNPWTPAAGYGALWVKNDAPSSLIYTDDAGTDIVKIGGAAPQFDMGNGTGVIARVGKAEFGSWPVSSGDAFFGHEALDHTVNGNQSIRITAGGILGLNVPTGQTGVISSNNSTELARWDVTSFRFADGSLTSPNPSYTADADTGFYRVGANILGLVAGGLLGAGNYGAVALGVADFSRVAAGAVLDLGASAARWGSVYGTTLDLVEQASNPITTAATRAQLWLTDDAAQRLVMEDDAGVEHVLAGPGVVTVTIASGALALPRLPQGARVIAAAESGTADTLDSITGGFAGQIIVLQADTGDTITCTDAAGVSVDDQLRLTASHTLASVYSSLTLQYTGSLWVELAVSTPA